MIVANHAYFAAMFGYTRKNAIFRYGGRCEVLDVFFCDTDIWSFIGGYGICIWALKDMIRLIYVTVGPTVCGISLGRLVVTTIIFPSIFQLNQ